MRIFIFLVFSAIIPLEFYSQDFNNVAFEATIKDREGRRIENAQIKLFQDGAEVNRIFSGKNGRVELILNFEHEYLIKTEKSGYVAKIISVNTFNVPEDEQAFGFEQGGYVVELFKDVPGIDYSILDKPIGKLYYERSISNFQYDKEYTKEIKVQVEALEKEYEQKKNLQEKLTQQREDEFNLALRDAELARTDGDLLSAKELLIAAQGIKPDSKIVEEKLVEVSNQLKQKDEKTGRFEESIKRGDDLVKLSKFSEAIIAYQEAKSISTNSELPDSKIAEVNKLLEAKKNSSTESDKQYKVLLANADALFLASSFEKALKAYQEASNLKPNEAYPKDRIAFSEKKLKENQIVDEYKSIIQQGDDEVIAEKFEEAKLTYQKALDKKPDETYPKQRIQMINDKLSSLAKAEAARDKELAAIKEFEDKIATGQKHMDAGDFDKAITFFKYASKLNPSSEIPGQKLLEIEKIKSSNAKEGQLAAEQAEKLKTYNRTVALADSFFNAEKFREAINSYEQAILIDASNTYPSTQITLINAELENRAKALAEKNEKDNLKRRYDDWVRQGDEAFGKKELSIARSTYNEALLLLPNETYPKEQLKKIDAFVIEEQKIKNEELALVEIENKFLELKAKADKLFDSKAYEQAKAPYRQAYTIKEDAYIDSRLKLIDERIQQLADAEALKIQNETLEREYTSLINGADFLFNSDQLDSAQSKFEKALILKPDELYPKSKIKSIEQLRAKRKIDEEKAEADSIAAKKSEELDAQYQKILKEGDRYRLSEEFDLAKDRFNEALSLKPNESYPKIQLDAMNKLIASRIASATSEREKREQYNLHIAKGDRLFNEKKWDDAKTAYTSAVMIYAKEPYPNAQLKEVERLRDEEIEATKKKEFEQIVRDADVFFERKQYTSSQNAYRKALGIFSGDKYCVERLNTISKIISEMDEDDIEKVVDLEKKVIEELFDEGRTKITIRKVIIGNNSETYKKVQHSWGGVYYFLDDKPISEFIWNKETSL